MADEDLHRVKVIPTVDTDGRPANLFVGQVEREGGLETAIRIDNGPAVLAPLEEVLAAFLRALREAAEDTYKRNQRGES